MVLRLILRPWLARRHEACLERIADLEHWHYIFEDWVKHGYGYDDAVEMAKQGVSFVANILREYYLPVIRDQLSKVRLPRG
jgi:hypothetical protein